VWAVRKPEIIFLSYTHDGVLKAVATAEGGWPIYIIMLEDYNKMSITG